MTPSQIQTLEELDRLQAVIDTPEKWVQRTFYNGQGCCLLWAYRKSGIPEGNWLAMDYMHESLLGFGSLIGFNDDPSTTHADVMALFERAKEKVRNS